MGDFPEDFFQAIVQNTHDALYVGGWNRLLFVNDRTVELMGYSREELLSMDFWELIHPDDRTRGIELAKKRFQGEKVTDRYSLRLVRKDGQVLEFEFHVSMISFRGEQVAVGAGREVTREKDMLRDLKQKEQQFQTLVNHSPDLYIQLDNEGSIVLVNTSGARILGFSSPKELEGSSIFRFLSESEKARLLSLIPQIEREGYRSDLVFSVLRRDGTTFSLQINVTVLKNPEIPDQVEGFVLIGRDITSQQQLLRRIQDSEHFLGHLIDMIPHPIYTRDSMGNYLLVNKRICDGFGLEKDEIEGYPMELVFEKAGMPVQQAKFLRAQDQKVLQSGKPLFISEFFTQEKDGEHIFQIQKFPIRLPQTNQMGILGINIDITEFVRLEKQLRESSEKAKKASEAKSRFLASMSHELRTPLNGILGFEQLLRKTTLNEEQEDFLENIKVSGKHLLFLIDQLLDLNQIEQNQLRLYETEVSVPGIVQGMIRAFTPEAITRGLKLVSSVDPDLPPSFQTDEKRLMQVLFNLLDNAIKFTPRGSVVLKATLEKSPPSSRIVFSVQDTGIGIPQEKIHMVFQPFFQADDSITRKHGGTGLGLSICSRLLKNLGGNLAVQSIQGKGSTFWFSLPLQPPIPNKDIPQRISLYHSVPLPERLRILAAEDEPINRKLLQRMLQREGWETVAVEDGKKAVDTWVKQPFDIILMDLQMPVMDGYTAMQTIRRMERDRSSHTPILAVSAYAMKDEVEKSLRAGADHHIPKPVEEEKLLQAIAALTQPGRSLG
ncbi:MAG TPA: PAS domain S-box protein [Thermotogota bacterium]|nr:PAS domain S-box protein [Thermotogota bacterium]